MSAVAEVEPGTATPPPAGRDRLAHIRRLILDLEPGDVAWLGGVSWDEYERLMAYRDGHRTGLRMAFDGGRLLLMPTGRRHERWKCLIARLLSTFALAADLPLIACGGMTVRRPTLAKGLEPDVCYYVQRAAEMLAVRDADFEVDPPPDLAIEVEMTRGAAGKLPIYAGLGVPEVWRWDGDRLTVLLLTAGEYAEAPASRAVPGLPPDVLAGFLRRAGTVPDTALCRELYAWANRPEGPA